MPDARPGQLRDDELSEMTFRGPFGGIQSELPLDDIEDVGFADAQNIIFRKGAAWTRPPFQALDPVPDIVNEPRMMVADFFTSAGNRKQVIATPTRLFLWNGFTPPQWTEINPVSMSPLAGGDDDLFTWTVVGQKLCFCQGVDKVQLWDGITSTYDVASANAVPAKYLFELATHLIAAHTVEGINVAPQRYRWTGAGDPTDWTSLNAGQEDLFNDLGPITGGLKLFQSGYIFHQLGITQLTPTGIGTKPFASSPLSAHSKGNICPYSLAAFGETIACYVGKNNIYVFDGTSSAAIGDAPIDGNRRVGALRKIFADLKVANLNKVYGFISSSIGGTDYDAYWLAIPGLSTWVYHFKENNWTRLTFDDTVSVMGVFASQGNVRIMDLVGTIQDQNWTFAGLTGNNPLDDMYIGFTNGQQGDISFGGTIETDFSLSSGQCYLRDRRHFKTLKRVVVRYIDVGSLDLTVTVTNENSVSVSQTKTIGGTGSGKVRIAVFDKLNISGHYLEWIASGSQQQMGLAEVRLVYDIGGEIR